MALLLQAIYGLRSERLLLEQLNYNMLYRWFVGLGADDPLWHHSSFSKNRERLLNEKVVSRFLETLLAMEEVKPLLSNDHFSVAPCYKPGHLTTPSNLWMSSKRGGIQTPRPLRPLRPLARALARLRQIQEGGRRGSVPAETSTGSASATAPTAAALMLMPAWPVVAKPTPPYSATGGIC